MKNCTLCPTCRPFARRMKFGRTAARVLATLALGAALTACGDGDGGMEPEPSIEGTWTLNQAALGIDASGGMAFSQSGGTSGLSNPDVIATYTTSGTTISMTDTSGASSCDITQIGVYTYTVNAASLSFQVQSDVCDGRRDSLTAGTWSRE